MKRLINISDYFKDGHLCFLFFVYLFHFSVYSEVLCNKEKRSLIESRKEYKLLEEKKKQAELDKNWLESSFKSAENRVSEIFNDKIKAQGELDEIFYKIDKPEAIKAYVEWKKAGNEYQKALEKDKEKTWNKYLKAGGKWSDVKAGFFKKIFYFLIYPSLTKSYIKVYKKHNKLESEWKKSVNRLNKLKSRLFIHPANPHPVTGISLVDMDLNHSRSKIKTAIDNLTFCKKVESL